MTIEEREKEFKNQVHRMISFPADVIIDFFSYWSEPNRSGTKMRFELEKTWDLNRRMRRWQLMGDTRKGFKTPEFGVIKNRVDTSVKPPAPKPINMIQQLDQFLEKYSLHPTEVPFADFSTYYEYMKQEKLLRPFTGQEVANLKAIYKDDNIKCRCACVQMTMDGYVKGLITFSKVMELRVKLTI